MSNSIPIIYASTSGHTQAVCEKVAELWTAAGQPCKLMRAEQTPLQVIQDNSVFVMASSTWEHGELNPFFHRLYDEIGTIDCSGKYTAFIGCGDSRYEPILFNQAVKLLRQHWQDQGGTEIKRPLLLQGEPFPQLNTNVAHWANEMLPRIQEHAK